MGVSIRLVVLALLAGVLSALAAPAYAADRDCGDFATQAGAQAFFLANGGPGADPHLLDSDGDGVACESNPCPCSYDTSPDPAPAPSPSPSPTPQPGPGPQPDVVRQWARVVDVTDGDTLKVRLATGRRRYVRILGIDTPEVHGGNECWGPEASSSMERMLPRGARVLLVSDPSQAMEDRYDRLLRYVQKGGRLDVGRKQVLKGHAEVYVYRNNPFQRTRAYAKAERRAKRADRGMWGAC